MSDPRTLIAKLTEARIALRHAFVTVRRASNDNSAGLAA